MKKCTKCKLIKNVESFYKDLSREDGLRSWCKNCITKYRYNNKEKIIERQRKFRKNNRKKVAGYAKKFYRANKELAIACQKRYYQVNKNKRAVYDKEYYQANKENSIRKTKASQ